MNESNIFLSWSGKLSNAVAVIFNKYLPFIVQESSTFYSPNDINKDKIWFHTIQTNLISALTGIIFLTKDNLHAEWILIEAGGLLSKGSLNVLLCDLSIQELDNEKTIFSNFNVTVLSEKDELNKLFISISKVISPKVDTNIRLVAIEIYT